MTIRAKIFSGFCLLLFLGMGWSLRQITGTFVVGLRLVPKPTGAVSCEYEDASGLTHTFPPQAVSGSGEVFFCIPSRTVSFRFLFDPTPEPYRIKALTLYHIPLFSAQWLNNMVNPDIPVYTQQYLGPNGTLDIVAPQGSGLSYPRFFNLLLRVSTIVRSLALPVCMVLCLILCGWNALINIVRVVSIFFERVCRFPATFAMSALTLATLSVACLTMPQPVSPISPGLDPSWNWLLNHFALNPLGIGHSVFFTYGPLGFTFVPLPIGTNAVTSLFCNAGYAVCYTVVILVLANRFKSSYSGCWLLLLCTAFLPSGEWRWSCLILIVLFLCVYLPFRHTRTLVLLSCLLGSLTAYSSLVKFTLTVTACLCIGIAVLHIAVFDKKKLPVFLLPLTLVLASSFLLASRTLFPSMNDILNWATVSWDIASGYNTVMVTQTSRLELLIPILLLASYLYAFVPVRQNPVARIALFVLASPLLFFAFKHSITRAGIGNCRTIAYVFPVVTALLAAFADNMWRPRLIRLFAFQFIPCLAFTVLAGTAWKMPTCGFNFKNTKNTLCLNTSIRTAQAESEKNLFPAKLPVPWLEQIGTNAVSVFSYELSYIPANDLTFVPFPILQPYSAYTRKLDKLGASLYTEENAPTWLFCEFNQVDLRNGMIDTPAIWNAIRARYQFVTSTNGLCLMKKKDSPSKTNFLPAQTMTVAQGEWLDIPERDETAFFLSVDWKQTLCGKLISLFFRNTFCSVTIEREDGKSQRWRFTPDTAQTPFPLDAIPFNDSEFVSVLSGSTSHALCVRRLRFDCENPAYYGTMMTITLYN